MDKKPRTFILDEKEYTTTQLSEAGLNHLFFLEFTVTRIQELGNNQSLLQRAKNSYLSSLRGEILSNKSGLLLDDKF